MPFGGLALHPSLLRAVRELGFVRPTPVQSEAIPPALSGRDVLASAETGSGKTAAFLLPILNAILGKPRGATRALVLVPTRELAAQVAEALENFATHTPATGAAIYGGVAHGPQEHALRSGVDVVIATPGRLLDHLRAPYARFDRLEHLVLDEADRMLDMGFLPEIRKILKHLPPKRQTLFFSATFPPPIAALAQELLRHPVMIQQDRKAAPPTGITQAIYPVRQDLKPALLAALLRRGDIRQALVFTRTKHRANRLADYLVRAGIDAGRIHGNRTQAQRTAALAAFKSGALPVLVATDIAARGIDVDALGHVVNFDVPLAPEDYIHRIGRTGRAQATGEAFTFAAPEDQREVAAIERAVGRQLPRITVPDFDYHASPAARLEIPIAQRIAEIRARKSAERARAADRARAAATRGSTAGHSGPLGRTGQAGKPQSGQPRQSGRQEPPSGSARPGRRRRGHRRRPR
jgi:ATP-dependent RNA helicase RhlE